MLDLYKTATTNQFEAVFCTLNACIEGCPEPAWDAPVVRLRFCQVVFHTLFYADYYLGENEETFRQQPFHAEHPDIFRDYEELQDRQPVLTYDKPAVREYLAHCRDKAATAVAAETTESLRAACGFARRDFSRAELHAVNIRHIHHHAAQLSLRLRIDHDIQIPWVGSAWQ